MSDETKIRVYVIKKIFTIESGISNLTLLSPGGHKCPLWPKFQFYCKKRSGKKSYERRAYEAVGKKSLSLGYAHAVNYLSILYWISLKNKMLHYLIDKDLIVLKY